MEKEDFSVFQLENHETKDVLDSHINGKLTVIWRNWDEYEPIWIWSGR